MTNDELDALVARLRRGYPPDVDPFEAADAITQLRAENERLRAAAQTVLNGWDCCVPIGKMHEFIGRLRDAIKEQK
jgi:hypothetical protein